MISSMTGYGYGTFYYLNHTVNIEIRSLNSKFLEINLKLSVKSFKKENLIFKLLKKSFNRGKIDLTVDIFNNNNTNYKLNPNQINAYLNELKKSKLGSIYKNIGEFQLLSLPGSIERLNINLFENKLFWKKCIKYLVKIIDKTKKDKGIEGVYLKKCILLNIFKFHKYIDKLKARIEQYLNNEYIKAQKSIKLLMAAKDNEKKQVVEIINKFLERNIISEEIDRINSHIIKIKNLLENSKNCGKHLDFLCQELNRELNTINSKCHDINVIELSILAKEEIEKIREQAQNIE